MSVSNIKRQTPNYNLTVPTFDSPIWQTSHENNLDIIDAVLYAVSGLSNVQGLWDNEVAYVAAQRVVSPADGTVWQVAVAHTSSSSGSFSDDRIANPTYWTQVITTFYNGGTWANATNYNTNAFIISGYKLGIAVVDFTSDSSYADDVSDGNIVTVLDFQTIVSAATSDAESFADAAELDAAATAADVLTAATSEANAAASAALAASIAGFSVPDATRIRSYGAFTG